MARISENEIDGCDVPMVRSPQPFFRKQCYVSTNVNRWRGGDLTAASTASSCSAAKF